MHRAFGLSPENVYYCCRYMAIMYSPIATDVFKNYLCGVNISCKDNRRMPIIFKMIRRKIVFGKI